MHYVDGVLLEGREILLTDWCVRNWLDYAQRRDGGMPAGSIELRDRLAAFADRETVTVVVSGPREPAKAADDVIVTESAPQQMTAAQAAAELGVSPQYARRLCCAGELLARKTPAGAWLVDADSVTARRKEQT